MTHLEPPESDQAQLRDALREWVREAPFVEVVLFRRDLMPLIRLVETALQLLDGNEKEYFKTLSLELRSTLPAPLRKCGVPEDEEIQQAV